MSIPVRIEIPAAEGVEGSVPEKLKLDLTQAHGIAVQLEEQGFGYGAFWCKPPTIREALWILWFAIRGKELRTSKTPSMAPWVHADDPYDPWTGEWKVGEIKLGPAEPGEERSVPPVRGFTGEPPTDQEQPPPPPPPPPPKKSKGFTE